ncbi:MAG: nucleotide exchange factor GrpE [Candidatus Zixiibacteriota bacterium]
MTEDKDTKDRIEIETSEAAAASGEKTPPPDAIEKDQDFSSATEAPTVEEAELTPEEQLQSRVAELEDRLLRTAAEYENYRKRTLRQADEQIRAANDRLLGELLEVMDNFERALSHINEKTDADSLQKGMELIYNQLGALLKRYDVVPIEAIGQKFDPALHDAMLQVESTTYEEGTVAMEMARGYRQADRVLRHSKVGVSKGKSS